MRWQRRRVMRQLFMRNGQLSHNGHAFLGLMADAADLGAVGMAENGRAETWRAGRQSLVREIMGWLDMSEADLMILRQQTAPMEDE